MSRNTFLTGELQYRVTAPVVVAKLSEGGERYVYRDGFLPPETMLTQIDHLLELGMIAKFGGAS